jgi:two-component system NtrC family sensor kinase
MNLRAQLRVGLAAKLAVCVIASTAAFFTLFGFLNLRMERAQSEDLVRQAAQRVTDVILRSTRYEMLRNDREALYNVIQELGSEPGIQRIRIFNKEGRITVSTDARERNLVVDKTAEQCYACHSQSAPLSKLSRHDRARIFIDRQGHRVLGVIQPIANSVECSGAACHVHPPGQTVLGVVDANLSLATVDAQMAAHQATLKWFLAGAIVFGCLAAVLFMWIVVYRPVKALIAGTHRVAGGDLNYRLPVPSEDELGDLARSFNHMTAKVAGVHEINNPLFGILTYARLVARELQKRDFPRRDELVEQLQTIEHESKRCGDLVKNLLTFSRQAPSHREPNDLNAIVRRAVLLVKHKLDMQNIELRENLAANLPPVDCDGNQIQQVVLVLLVNASEAMPKGGTIEVATELDAAGEQGVVRVKDTGTGIPADALGRIFDPFFTTKEDQNRTGLGLAVAHSIVEQHGGDIAVQTQEGVGTEFRITLPAVAVAAGGTAR